VDSANENRVYHVAGVVNVSDDGGRSFGQLMQSYGPVGVHPDHHAFWIDPTNEDYLIEGNDGGLNIFFSKICRTQLLRSTFINQEEYVGPFIYQLKSDM